MQFNAVFNFYTFGRKLMAPRSEDGYIKWFLTEYE